MIHRWLALVGLSITIASISQAQDSGGLGKLRGRVVDSLTRVAIADANVEIVEANLRQTTDSSGRFMFAAVPFGQYVTRVRHLGYRDQTDTIRIEEADSTERELILRRVPPILAEIVIRGRPVQFPRFFEPAYKRAASGRGYFFTREDIERLNATDYQTLLNRIPGVSANDRGVTFQRCQVGFEYLGKPDAKPHVQVWINGFRTTIEASDPTGINAVLRMVKPYSVQIMEVYPSTSTIPADFLSDACAVILIWTKRD